MLLIAQLEAFVAMLIWASSFLFIKVALLSLSPFQLVGLRYFTGFLVLSPFLWLRSRQRIKEMPLKIWGTLAVIGLVAYPLGNGLIAVALQTLSASMGSFIFAGGPLFTLLIGVLTLKEYPTRLQWWGVALVVAGAGLFFSRGLAGGELTPILLMVIASFSLSYFVILSRGLARQQAVDTLTLTAIPLAIGGGLLLLVIPPTYLPGVPPVILIVLGVLGFFNTALATTLWNHALQHLKAFEANVIINLAPMLTALMAMFAFDESLLPVQWFGMAVTVFGVIVVGAKSARQFNT